MVVGTKSGTIHLIRDGDREVIMKSHNQGEVWGLTIISEDMIATTGDDNQVMIWNTENRKQAGTCIVNSVA